MAKGEPRNRSYILAERSAERVGIAMVNFFELWRDANGPNAIPGVNDCEEYITSFLDKEVLRVKWATIKQIRAMRDDATDQIEYDTARDIMVADSEIEKKLKLEHL
jgi:hypothetical protein